MTETDIFICVFEEINFRIKDEVCHPSNNIILLEGIIDGKLYKAKLYFKLKTEEVTHLNIESIENNFDTLTYNKKSFKEKYKSTFRDILLKDLV